MLPRLSIEYSLSVIFLPFLSQLSGKPIPLRCTAQCSNIVASSQATTEAFGRSSGRKATQTQPAANLSEDDRQSPSVIATHPSPDHGFSTAESFHGPPETPGHGAFPTTNDNKDTRSPEVVPRPQDLASGSMVPLEEVLERNSSSIGAVRTQSRTLTAGFKGGKGNFGFQRRSTPSDKMKSNQYESRYHDEVS